MFIVLTQEKIRRKEEKNSSVTTTPVFTFSLSVGLLVYNRNLEFLWLQNKSLTHL